MINVPTYSDNRGDLSVIDKLLPFTINRVFYIYNTKGNKRGGHRHRKTKLALICVAGQCLVYTNDGKIENEYVLDSEAKCLLLFPQDWHIMHSFSDDAVLLVLASEHFDLDDYIGDVKQ